MTEYLNWKNTVSFLKREHSFTKSYSNPNSSKRKPEAEFCQIAAAGTNQIATLGDSSITTKKNNRKRSNFQPVLSKTSKSPSFTVKQLTIDKNILVNKKIRHNFGKPNDSSEGLVKRYDFASDSYVEANFASICAHVAKAASEANDRVSQPNSHTLYTEQKTTKVVLNAPDEALWKLAMDKEIHLLQDVMGCWEVMNISEMTSKVKFRENVYDKHRARIVAIGYQQRQGVDYFQSFSPTASQISVRLVMV
jgi:hypothetical protein